MKNARQTDDAKWNVYKSKLKTLEQKRAAYLNKFRYMTQPFMYCPECGKNIWNDQNNIQRHFLWDHSVNDQKRKWDKGWKVVPGTGRPKFYF